MRNIKQNKVLWILTALLTLVSSLIGVFNPAIYERVVDRSIMAGVYSQDLTAIVAAVLIVVLTIGMKEKDFRKQTVIIGLLGFLFYGYGIYAIERIYNFLYYLYLAVFSLSFYTIIYSTLSIAPVIPAKIKMSALMRYISIFFLFLIPVMFGFLWISELKSLIAAAEKIEYLYSVYVLDLCFIMPAFAIIGYKTIKKESMALLLAPALFITGVTLLLPVGVGELLKPLYGAPIDTGGLILYLSLSIMFLLLAFFHLRSIET